MPFLHGVTLEQYLGNGPLPWPYAVDISLEIGSALGAIHEGGAIHRGLKPANVWIVDGEHPHVLLSDCGIGRFTELPLKKRPRSCSLRTDIAATLIPPGALAYMSPEQVMGEAVDYRTDIFSFGVVLYEMLSGRHPFESRNSLSRISAILEAQPPPLLSKHVNIPVQLESILLRALAKNCSDRFQSMQELMDQIRIIRKKELSPRVRMEMRSGIRKWLFSKITHYLGK
jgi:serine/threonine protein kinase